ncbi:MAG: hypothetical protein DRP01_02065 [Archaeoglobales archaeon]|nr:MAG: hypothetical protein DRP01_02065 [Archaeoglobales archaeon]
MICQKCGKEFKPDSDIERLMAVGQIARVCDNCAARPVAPTPLPLSVIPLDTTQMQLHRLDWFDKQRKLIRFMSLPPKRNYNMHQNTLRRPRKSDQHVFIMSSRSDQLNTTPAIRIRCNIDNFQEQRTKFYAVKTPDAWDPFTGISRMEVPFQQIDRVEKEGANTVLHLTTGERIRLLYR